MLSPSIRTRLLYVCAEGIYHAPEEYLKHILDLLDKTSFVSFVIL